MTPSFHTHYHPLTSRPYLQNSTYTEHTPCRALKPYVACFWTSMGEMEDGEEKAAISVAGEREPLSGVLVIPDTCVDVIIELNHGPQTVKSRLCGIQDYSVTVGPGTGKRKMTTFAVRFYFWAVRLFLDLDMRDIYNGVLDFELLVPGSRDAFQELFYQQSLRDKIEWMEEYLLKKLDTGRLNANFFNSVDHMLRSRGCAAVKDICGCASVSQRQMERLFRQEIGISIKRTASLVRYQNVWREIVCRERFEIQEAVGQFGYADQAHLLNDFKRFHSVWPVQAKQIAMASR